MVGLVLLGLFGAGVASAHPMGTLSVNRSLVLQAAPESIEVAYTVDFAEVPSTAEVERLHRLGAPAYAAARGAELLPGVSVRLHGAEDLLDDDGCAASTAAGEGGLPVVELRCTWRRDLPALGRLEVTDTNFEGTPGWRELRLMAAGVVAADVVPPAALVAPEASGTLLRPMPFTAPAEALELTRLTADLDGAGPASVGAASVAPRGRDADPLAALLTHGELSAGFLAVALATATLLGAGHALSPGHGKTVVAAYLVGQRGTVAHALLLGLVVTATHVSSVLLLGAVTLGLSEYVVAADLYPWLGVGSGLGVVLVGWGVFRSRLAGWRRRAGAGPLADGAAHTHEHLHLHALPGSAAPTPTPRIDTAAGFAHDHAHGPGGHEHIHRDERGEPVSLGRLLLLGVTGGAVPCPSALVVLLAAISLHRVALGMMLIVAFSVGLAGVLMAIGVLVVRAQRVLARAEGARRYATYVALVSPILVMGLGLGIATQAAREAGWF